MLPPEWIWLIFVFAFGACIGSFLNVVIYRLPRDQSLVHPPSTCPACNTPIRFYDNIPLVSWLLLRAKCRNCKSAISPRYFIIELLTALMFTGLYLWLFAGQGRPTGLAGAGPLDRFFPSGGWLIFLSQVILVACFIAASAIDLELWVIPLSLCWIVTAAGLISSSLGPVVLKFTDPNTAGWFPTVRPAGGAIAVGAAIGLAFSLLALRKKWIPESYAIQQPETDLIEEEKEPEYNDRKEVGKEILFLMPVIAGGLFAWLLVTYIPAIGTGWAKISQVPVICRFLGALGGYFAGCAIVWGTRIFGTLAFGREAMGLGDVHLMGAAGTVLGPGWVVLSFFVAPFFGLLWALYQMFFKKTRQIPYGPFLSLAVFLVMIFQDRIYAYLADMYGI